jgi:hypothetical protein
MKTKIPHLILAGLFGTAIASQGAVIVTVSDADFDPDAGEFGTSDLGTLVRDINVVDGASPQTLQYTVTGLTIDDDGTANDSVTIAFSASTINSINSGENNSSQGFFSDSGSWLGAGDWTRMDFTSISVNVSGGGFSAAEFLGFTELTVQLAGGGETGNNGSTDEFTINGTTYADDAGDFAGGSDFAIANDDFILLTAVEVATGTGTTAGTYRHFDLNYQFSATAVPEPSSTALLGLGGLALMLRRKRSAA